MAVYNNLPAKGGKEPVLTFVGSGWKQASGGNHLSIQKMIYRDSAYWSYSSDGRIECQKAFTALVVLMQGNNTDAGTTARRTLYILTDVYNDIVDTGTGQYLQANNECDFAVGDIVGGWQENSSSAPQGTVGFTMIFDIDPR